ncbi:hypothetical protein ACSNOI_36995 [Actinomadura kijaniata]|uniref:hypothetical protein n=1 Tax=Actinomadura kijaniata TaxID=46161 RepID=UPI003F1CD146
MPTTFTRLITVTTIATVAAAGAALTAVPATAGTGGSIVQFTYSGLLGDPLESTAKRACESQIGTFVDIALKRGGCKDTVEDNTEQLNGLAKYLAKQGDLE